MILFGQRDKCTYVTFWAAKNIFRKTLKLNVNNLNTVHVVLRIPVWAFSDIT